MIDWQIANDLKQAIGPEVFEEVVTVFFQETDSTLNRLLGATTADAMKSELHFMKGSALNLGFSDLAQICQRLESRAEAGESDLPLAQVKTIYSASQDEFSRRRAEMIA
ncbi:MAG: Hpt domain-containing protein [Pseudotabrizicola sp.]|uniref:Hpt domain-containing protein n=1 Tax=Pseudotabrizicola sp. TaxID=2939647 RepID=UPI00271B2B5B|nr:Hpt domain-containing protein [Pseudotabrizicola sp.]MDO9639050.1 Hpt domain-containing protein [Pseudotabrizicola sp.]